MCHISLIPFVSVVGHDATLTQGKTVVEVIAAVYIRLPVLFPLTWVIQRMTPALRLLA